MVRIVSGMLLLLRRDFKMKLYLALLTVQKDFKTSHDDPIDMMAKCLTVTEKYFTVKRSAFYVFDRDAFTYAMILAESHAVVQTYPELDRIFISVEYHEEDPENLKIDIFEYLADLNTALEGTGCSIDVRERYQHVLQTE